MTELQKKNLRHLRWAVKSRNENQRCAIRLFELMHEHEAKCKKEQNSLTAQALVGVTFSLWRAAFLADKSSEPGMSLKSATSFLEQIILNNNIAFTHDRNDRHWTFNYYLNNARHALRIVNEIYPDLAPEWQVKARSAKERWEYAQDLLDQTVAKFKAALSSKS